MLLSAALLCGQIAAFGSDGHWLSGRIAQEFLGPEAVEMANELLPEYKGELKAAASWADTYRWSSALHYLNPLKDSPPTICQYSPATDCPDKVCAVGAVHNFTQILQESSDKTRRSEALKFLIHIIGDLHQPLHVTGRDRGGTQALVKFDRRTASLHTKRMQEQFGRNRENYAQSLIARIRGEWSKDVEAWQSCPKLPPPLLTFNAIPDRKYTTCPEVWARYANIANCVNVWPEYKPRYEMSGSYYQKNILVAEKMLAMSAIRMASTLDAISRNLMSQ